MLYNIDNTKNSLIPHLLRLTPSIFLNAFRILAKNIVNFSKTTRHKKIYYIKNFIFFCET